jgi:hypothetical protein
MDRLVQIDGSLSLSGTQSRCEFEQEGGFKLTTLKFGTLIAEGNVFPINKAEFENASVVDILNKLTFVQAGDSDDLENIKSQASGLTFMFDTQIYVQNKLTRVVVFGKQD